MGTLTRVSCAVGMLLAACAPVASGPELPRPVTPAPATTSTIPASTTTVDSATSLSTECPSPFCLVYHIAPDARWSDGIPVTSEDFSRTVDLLSQPAGPAASGYDLITSIDIIDPKTFRAVFSAPYGAWQQLFDRVTPASADPRDVTTMSSTGAFVLSEWVPGDRIVVTRNADWWSTVDRLSGAGVGTIEQITFVFIADLEEMVDALETGEVDVITARPSVETVARLSSIEGVGYTVAPGPFWEHIDFHHEDRHLGQTWLRQAISLAIDREKVLDRTIRLFDPTATGLDNTVWMSNAYAYEPHFDDRYDPAAAEALLLANSCARGDDSVFVCGGRRMSFVWATTNDDPARRETFDSVREDLEVIGIEVVGDFRTPSAFVTREYLFGGPGVWQLVNFSWRAPSDPGTSNRTYFCGDSELNVNGYCSEEVERLVRSTESMVDPEERAAAYNEADRLYLDDLAVIPLYQKPSLMAWGPGISGPMPNYTTSSDMWNVAAWTGREALVVALPAEPGELDPFAYDDDNANSVISTLLYGAFGMDSSLQRIPVLVDAVDIIED